MSSKRGYSDQELCDAVYQAVATSEKDLSRLEICERIGRTKSPRIIEMIEHLHKLGYFYRYETKGYRGLVMFRYGVEVHNQPTPAACSEQAS